MTVDSALRLNRSVRSAYHKQHLNPRLARVLEVIGADREYVRASGMYAWDRRGERVTDFLAGFGAVNLGHNHPAVWDALLQVRDFPNLLDALNPFEAALAHALASRVPGSLRRAYFASSGAEAVDTALKLTRAATGRARLVGCRGSFHGRTIGALSIMDTANHRSPFEPLLADVTFVAFGDLEPLESALRKRDVAAFIVEPIQAEGGFHVPPAGYLPAARDLCTRYGTLFVADEIQTGLGRTGKFVAVEAEGIIPDVLLLGKALGGGIMPVSALLTSDEIFRAGGGGTPRTPFHHATFGGNALACAAALATLGVLEREHLADRAATSGAYLLERLGGLRQREPLIGDIRGRGLLIGIELTPPQRGMASLLSRGMGEISRAYLGGAVVMDLLNRHNIVTAFALNRASVVRLEPPLIVERHDLDHAVDALEQTLRDLHRAGQTAFRLARPLVKAWLA